MRFKQLLKQDGACNGKYGKPLDTNSKYANPSSRKRKVETSNDVKSSSSSSSSNAQSTYKRTKVDDSSRSSSSSSNVPNISLVHDSDGTVATDDDGDDDADGDDDDGDYEGELSEFKKSNHSGMHHLFILFINAFQIPLIHIIIIILTNHYHN